MTIQFEQYEYLVMLGIEECEVGHVYEILPLHCTLLHWCATSSPSDAFLGEVLPVLLSLRAMRLTTMSEENFGPNNDIPVFVVEKTSALIQAHFKVLEAIQGLGAKNENDAWVAEGYRPHITETDDRDCEMPKHQVSCIAHVVQALDPGTRKQKRVIASIWLD